MDLPLHPEPGTNVAPSHEDSRTPPSGFRFEVGDALASLLQGEREALVSYRAALADPASEPGRVGLELLMRRHARAETLLRSTALMDAWNPPRPTPRPWCPASGEAKDLRSLLLALRSCEGRWTRAYEASIQDPTIASEDRALLNGTLLPGQRAHEAILDRLLGVA